MGAVPSDGQSHRSLAATPPMGAKVFHRARQGCTMLWDVIRTRGIRGGEQYILHRTPGFGDTNWTDIISILRMEAFAAPSISKAGTIPSIATTWK